MRTALPLATVLALLTACGEGGTDTPGLDGGAVTPPLDAGGGDASPSDAGGADAGGGDAGSPDDDAGALTGSEGCGTSTSLAEATWVEQTVDVAGASRTYFVRLPAGYDPSRPYPVVYQFHGCSDRADRESNNVPVEREAGAEAIHVRGRAAARCWDTGATGPDVAFFDAMVARVEAALCADPTRRFATGYSSGAFMTHRLACVRGDVLRGVATIAGGQAGRGCAGQVGALLIHDTDDTTVNLSASVAARDALVEANGCDADAPRAPTDDPPCEAYAGCDPDHPVVWCQTSGRDHARQDALAAPAFWRFLSSLP